jgi:uncharacterized membrane protein
MTPRGKQRLLTIGAGLLIALYIGLLHLFTARGTPSLAGAALAVGPFVLMGFWLAWQSRHRSVALGAWLLAIGALVVWRQPLASNFAYVNLIQHAGTFGTLSAVFGRTLAAGRKPMVSMFAEAVHGPLVPGLARYTRGVTVAWTLVFAAMTLLSLALFASGHIAAWSLFANVLTPVIIPAVFLIEYLVRRTTLPPELQTGLVDSIRSAWPAFDRWSSAQDDTASPSERHP